MRLLTNPLIVVAISLAIFVLIWCGTLMLIARIGGWAALAERYRGDAAQFRGARMSLRAGRMRWVSYRGVLTLGADPRGLYIAAVGPFRPGHPPLYIPWHAIDVRYEPYAVVFVFRELADARLTLFRPLGEQLVRLAQVNPAPSN